MQVTNLKKFLPLLIMTAAFLLYVLVTQITGALTPGEQTALQIYNAKLDEKLHQLNYEQIAKDMNAKLEAESQAAQADRDFYQPLEANLFQTEVK